MLKNWVTETGIVKYDIEELSVFQLYVKELSNWNYGASTRMRHVLKFQLYVKELSNWNIHKD